MTQPNFTTPSFVGQGGTGIQMSMGPLGLVELSDEEFEVSGPRLNRYSVNWSFYLGQHWAYQREVGEPQLTFNWFRAFTDFIATFTFGRGVNFSTPKITEAIAPDLLQRVWEIDNNKQAVLWEIAQQGGVTGDAFTKVAYEEPFVDSVGRARPGRVRILPLTSAHCFPEWHPHDKERLIRFKLKYRFYGTAPEGTRQVFTYTEIITDDEIAEYINDILIQTSDGTPNPRPNPLGQIPIVHIANTLVSGSPWGLADCQDTIALNREYNEKATEISDIINYHGCVDDETEALTTRGWMRRGDLREDDTLLARDPDTDEIRWVPMLALNTYDYDGSLIHWTNRVDALTTPNHRWLAERKVGRPENVRYVREIVRTAQAQDGDDAAGDLRDGSRVLLGGGIPAHFPTESKWHDDFVETIGWWVTEGCIDPLPSGSNVGFIHQSDRHNPSHVDAIRRLGAYWRNQGATWTEQKPRENGVIGWYLGVDVVSALESVCPDKSLPADFLNSLTYRQAARLLEVLVDADGSVTTDTGRVVFYQDDQGRIDGYQMLAAMLNGARTNASRNIRGNGVVESYQTETIEILSTLKTAVEVPYSGKVWCPTVEGGIWFARRNGVTYWTGNSPITVVLGAKASNLEKGPKKVWAIPTAGADVKNLELGSSLAEPMAFLELLKRSMHEMTGIPETALGQVQPISNTSGVALSIQYQPLMARFHQKVNQYAKGLEKINELVLLTLALKEPQALVFDPGMDLSPLKPGQLDVLDPADPVTYRSTVHFPPPLPIDKLILLNEIQLLQSLGLESREGALRLLGEEDPAEKLAEIRQELKEDAVADGALQLIKTQIQAEIMNLTGLMPGPDGAALPPMQDGGIGSDGTPGMAQPQMPEPVMDMAQMLEIQGEQEIRNQLVADAYGTKLPQRNSPSKGVDGE